MQSTACHSAAYCDLNVIPSRAEARDMDDFTLPRMSWLDFGRRLLGLREPADLPNHVMNDIGLNHADLAALEF